MPTVPVFVESQGLRPHFASVCFFVRTNLVNRRKLGPKRPGSSIARPASSRHACGTTHVRGCVHMCMCAGIWPMLSNSPAGTSVERRLENIAYWVRSAKFWPGFDPLRGHLRARILPNLRRARPNMGRLRPTSGRSGPNRSRPNRAEFSHTANMPPTSAQFGTCWSACRLITANFGRHLPMLVHVRQHLAAFDKVLVGARKATWTGSAITQLRVLVSK